jgi:hypothetical protein
MAVHPMLFEALREFFDGLLHQLLVNLSSDNGREWHSQLGKFLRKEITWGGGLIEKNVFAVVEGLEIRPVDKPDALCNHRSFRHVQVDEKSDEDLLSRPLKASHSVRVLIGLTTQEGISSQIFSQHLRAIGDLERLRLTQSQISAFCSEYKSKLTFNSQGHSSVTLFLCTVDDEPINEDLSNVRTIESSFHKSKEFDFDHRTLYVRGFYPRPRESKWLDGLHVVFPIPT